MSANAGIRCGAAALVAGIVGARCSLEHLAAAPSELTSGIVIYEDANYLGQSAHLVADTSSLSDFEGPCEHESSSCTTYGCTTSTSYDWEDCISSIKVAPGWRATIYEDSNFHGRSFELAADAPNLQLVAGPCKHDTFNDCVSSIRVRPQ